MKNIKIVLLILTLLVITLLFAYSYYGGFTTISPTVKKVGGETLIYEKMSGDYSQSHVVSDRVYYKLLSDFKIETKRGFGIYYDNPKEVPTEELYAEVGCILEPKDLGKVDLLIGNFEVTEFPIEEYITVEFPFKGKLSVLIGLMKVYPALASFSKENGYESNTPIMEIWDVTNKTTTYRMKIKSSHISGN